MMGYSYNLDNGPLQCFNPAKTYQLGWLNDKTVEVDPNNGRWEGVVIGAVDYSNPNVDQNANVIIKVDDLYIGYNRKKGMNSEVHEAGDAIVIVQQGPGYANSDFLATLTSEDPIKIFNNFGGNDKNLVVELNERRSWIDEVTIAVYYDNYQDTTDQIQRPPTGIPSFNPTPPPTNRPTFPQPTAPPTNRPTFPQPTALPTNPPTFPQPTVPPTLRRPTPTPTRERMYDISYNSPQTTPQSTPRELLTENFRDGLGAFISEGNSVTRDMYQYVLTAKFEMNEIENLPSMYTEFDLLGTSVIQVSFWYSAQSLQYGEGFKLQFSTDHGNSWIDVRTYHFGENGFDTINSWNFAKSETFRLEQGVSTTKIRFVGETATNNGDSVFHLAGINVFGMAV